VDGLDGRGVEVPTRQFDPSLFLAIMPPGQHPYCVVAHAPTGVGVGGTGGVGPGFGFGFGLGL
jgi:hypothetical protein